MFFSEEKNQKTFILALISTGASPAGTHGDITCGKKFFGSFFQKRTLSFLPVRWVSVSAGWYNKKRKVFFFEKKNQKTFIFRRYHQACWRVGARADISELTKVFWFFSSEKNSFFPCLPA